MAYADDFEKARKLSNVATLARSFKAAIAGQMPDGREKSIALTKLDESVLWASTAIAGYPPGYEPRESEEG